jgi:hypothetical protein
VVKKKQGQYEVLGVIKTFHLGRRPPVAVMISRNVTTGDLSFQVGFLRNGRIDSVRYWQGEAFMSMASLCMFLGQRFVVGMMTGKKITREYLKESVEKNHLFQWVEEYIPEQKKLKASMTLGERAVRKDHGSGKNR